VIAKANKAIAKRAPSAGRPEKRIAGLNAGGITYVADDFDAPLPEEFWDGDPNDALNSWIREQARRHPPRTRDPKPSRSRAKRALARK
jgi:hypothetical protein